MKRLLTHLLCLLYLLMLPAAVLAETHDDILPTIYQIVEDASGLTADAFNTPSVYVLEDGIWEFILQLKDHPENEDGVFHGTMTSEGEVLFLRGPMKLDLERQAMYAVGEAMGHEDTYLRLAEVVAAWRDKLDLVIDRQDFEEQMIHGRGLSIIDILMLDIRTPDEKAIPYLDALSAAKHYVLAQPGWSEKALRRFEVTYSAYTVPRDMGKPVWQFLFDEIIDINDLNWTINGKPAPIHFSIIVDAETGDILDSCFDYAPMRFTIPQHIIRPKTFYDPAPLIDGAWG